MPQTVNELLAVVGAIASGLSLLIAWGFTSGKFIQRYTDQVEDLRKRVSALAERVTYNEARISDGEKARHGFIDRVNVELGRLRHKYELMQQRMNIDEKHGDERHERIDEQLARVGDQLNDLQREIDRLNGRDIAGFDPPDRRRR